MNPAFSVIFLTTLTGAGQGLFIALVLGRQFLSLNDAAFQLTGSLISLGLLVLGLAASFFHLGRPERAWRAASQWKTSWLSREVIVLPVCMAMAAVYAWLQYQGNNTAHQTSMVVGWVGVAAMMMLFVCTGMIYACIRFLQEWASPWTLINFTVLGLASGVLVASVLSAYLAPDHYAVMRMVTLVLLVTGLTTRAGSIYRNARIRHQSTIQSAIGIKHRHITQRSMGFTGGSFNTRAFFHHCSDSLLSNMRLFVFVFTFIIPIAIVVLCADSESRMLLVWVLPVQYAGLVAERWLFFAQASHPQNIYYQTVG